jgi:hypothetical protein
VICDDPTEMVAAARVAEKLFDRARIRRIAEQRWSAERMAADYLRIYQAARQDRLAPAATGSAAEG